MGNSYNSKENLKIQELYSKNYNNFIIELISYAVRKYNCSYILDYGCADGFFIKKLRQKFGDIQLEGLDTDGDFILRCEKCNIKVHELISNCGQNFDMVYMLNVLEHIENDIQALKEVYDKLKQNGVLVIYVPAFMFLYSSMDKKAGHFRRYSLKELKNIIEQAGGGRFKIEKAEYCDSIGILAIILYKIKECLFKSNNGEIKVWQVKIYDFFYPLGRLLDKLFFRSFFGKNIYAVAVKYSR